MHLVAVKDLKGNEIIGEDIIRDNGVILLNKGTRYRTSFSEKLLQYKIDRIYVDDKISEGIKPTKPLIIPEQKAQIVNDFSNEFEKIVMSKKVRIEPIQKIANSLVELLSRKEAVYDLINIKTNAQDIYEHTIEVTIMVYMLCKRLKLEEEQINTIVIGSLLRDIGMIFVPKEILEKKTKRSPGEQKIMQDHAEQGYKLIKDDEEIEPLAKIIVLCHHEREDGSGYPLGKKEDLPLGAKIVAACDAFVEINSGQTYKEDLELNEVVILLRKERLNDKVERALEAMLNFYPVGTAVLLSNKTVGIVEKNYKDNLERPVVRIVIEYGRVLTNYYKVDLSQSKDIFIERILTTLDRFR